jgi:four helix bundle protein
MKNKLEVWRLSHELTLQVYKVSHLFPKFEQFGLCSQMRRSSASIPTNIVEGQARNHLKEFIQFLYIARGSQAELSYQIFLAYELNYFNENQYDEMNENCNRVGMMLNKLIGSLQSH